MGAAAYLFYNSNDPEKQTLHRRIIPSEEQFEEQQDRWNALADFLVKDLKERSGHNIRTWLQGSYKFGTQVRPVHLGEEFDIDLGVYYEWEGKSADGKHSAKALKSFVQDSLQAYARGNPDDVLAITEPRLRCCRIRFKHGFHIDVPCYHLDPKKDTRALATDNGWEKSDPKAIYIWFRDSFDDATRTKVRRHVKYVKAWAALKFNEDEGRPSSILLTVLVAEAAKMLGAAKIASDDDSLALLLREIVDRLEDDTEVLNPTDKNENLARLSDDQMATFLERLRSHLDVADRALAKGMEIEAADIWQEAFEHMFPMPEVSAGLLEKAGYPLPVRYSIPEVAVVATARNNPAGRFSGTNAIGPIPKNCDIRFQIINQHAMPNQADVIWMVRNEGREAENINDLGHFAGRGLTANEHSAYKGVHYMDCVVKVAGNTVAMRRVPVQISGLDMPRRNPLRRPEWVKLRGRR